ncbi:ankyrin repeats (3 copies) domain-containing protein [Ditylenchus destructor]|uniref:Ankyrin repeats (3 copies) domain-containing protein n=1 Tax=Ditylenchus destructor TaxID=166010 RepID=A0AAD4MMJ0_9BILA|nr:ankyrin repeats (3 copies) domain-containing protein [Ditylenchus destructor]
MFKNKLFQSYELATIDIRRSVVHSNSVMRYAMIIFVSTLVLWISPVIVTRNVPENGQTPLHIAAAGDSPWYVGLLVSRGADVNAKDKNDQTPLHIAAGNGNPAISTKLIFPGADVNAKDKNGQTALHIAAGNQNKKCSLIASYLAFYKADVNARDKNRQTPLHIAAANENPAIAINLVIDGADVNAEDKDGRTPLDVAVANKRIINGYNISSGDHPWLVSLLFPKDNGTEIIGGFCGGTILSDRWILTAAHCTGRDGLAGYRFFYGAVNYKDAEAKTVKIKRSINHPEFHRPKRNLDISLAELSEPLSFNDKVQPICLVKKYKEVRHSMAVIGWESYSASPGQGPPGFEKMPTIAQETNVPLANLEECTYENFYNLLLIVNFIYNKEIFHTSHGGVPLVLDF